MVYALGDLHGHYSIYEKVKKQKINIADICDIKIIENTLSEL